MPLPPKTRALRKYEAAATPQLTLGEAQQALDFYSPFGPMIAKARLPQALIDRLNGWADGVANPDKSTEFLVPEAVFAAGGRESLAQIATGHITRYLEGLEGSRAEQIGFEVFWVVSQYAGTSSPVHFHSSDIAGVLYLKVPQIDAAQESRTYISGRNAGYINFIAGGKQRFAKSIISFKPEVGDLYLFPGWLLHVAEPFIGNGERRSLSFNARVAVAGD